MLAESISKWEEERARKIKECEENGAVFVDDEEAIELENQLRDEEENAVVLPLRTL